MPSFSWGSEKGDDANQSILNRLRNYGHSELQDVRCEVQDDHTRFFGQLPSYHLKQLAQTAILETRGSHRIVNLIEVQSSKDEADSRYDESECEGVYRQLIQRSNHKNGVEDHAGVESQAKRANRH